MRAFAYFFAMQFVSYALIVANGRAYVQGNYLATASTDALIASQNFILTKRMISTPGDLGKAAMAGYVLGGMTGALAAIWFTRLVYGQ